MLKDFSYHNETIETVNEGDSSNILVDVDNSNIVFDNTVSSIQNRHSRSKITPIRLGMSQRRKSPEHQLGRNSSAIRNQFGTVMCTYTVFWTCRRENNKQYRVSIELADSAKVVDAIKAIVTELNKAMLQQDSNYILSSDPSAYEVYKAKKNGEPKDDYPALDEDQVLYVTGIQALTLIESRISAVAIRTPVFIGMPMRKMTESSMVSSTMPPAVNGSPYKYGSQDVIIFDDVDEKSICWCFKAKRKMSENMSNGLNTKLLD